MTNENNANTLTNEWIDYNYYAIYHELQWYIFYLYEFKSLKSLKSVPPCFRHNLKRVKKLLFEPCVKSDVKNLM